jgi:hypothetical protein
VKKRIIIFILGLVMAVLGVVIANFYVKSQLNEIMVLTAKNEIPANECCVQ